MSMPLNDRTWLLEQQQAQRQEAQALDVLEHYAQQGMGLAMFCQSFLTTLLAGEQRVTRDEALRLLRAAILGRVG